MREIPKLPKVKLTEEEYIRLLAIVEEIEDCETFYELKVLKKRAKKLILEARLREAREKSSQNEQAATAQYAI